MDMVTDNGQLGGLIPTEAIQGLPQWPNGRADTRVGHFNHLKSASTEDHQVHRTLPAALPGDCPVRTDHCGPGELATVHAVDHRVITQSMLCT